MTDHVWLDLHFDDHCGARRATFLRWVKLITVHLENEKDAHQSTME